MTATNKIKGNAELVIDIILLLGSVAMVLPFVWMLCTSFKTPPDAIRFPPTFIPRPLVLDNYVAAFTRVPMLRFILNSAIYTLGMTIPSLLLGSLAGFVFAKMRFPGRELIFLSVLGTMMVPLHVRLIPLYNMMVNFRWVDTYWGVVVPGMMGPFGVFFFRQHISTIPDDLIDAALIDGCGYFRIYWNVIVPQLKPAFGAYTIFCFMWGWNDFLWPLIVVNSERMKPLEIGIASFSNINFTQYGLSMAGASVAVMPIIVVFLLMQRQFVEGITMTGIKG